MTDQDKLSIFPEKRIKPLDGLAVSAEVWELAHQEHRDMARAQNVVFHGEGIITGLEIVANDPPNNLVYISPGAAIDREGNVIVVTERIAYDFGETSTGELFLLIARGSREVAGEEEGTIFIQHEFMVAARSSLTKRPSVELARVTRGTAGQAISNAASPRHPVAGQLDLRFRDQIGVAAAARKHLAVVDFGDGKRALAGCDALALEAERWANTRLLVEPVGSIPAEAGLYEMVLVSFGNKGLTKGRSEDLKRLVSGGGKVLIETTSQAVFGELKALLEESGVQLAGLGADHALMREPYRFAKPPLLAMEDVLVAKSVALIHGSVVSMWDGSVGDQVLEREQIRSAYEWGLNLITFLVG